MGAMLDFIIAMAKGRARFIKSVMAKKIETGSKEKKIHKITKINVVGRGLG